MLRSLTVKYTKKESKSYTFNRYFLINGLNYLIDDLDFLTNL